MKFVIQRVSQASVTIDGQLYSEINRGFLVLIGVSDEDTEGAPAHAEALYEYVIKACQKEVPVVKTGSFGADMKVALQNDGPFTVVLDSKELGI